MKAFLSYALFVIPIPILIGFLISAVVYVPASAILRRCTLKVRTTVFPYLEFFTGGGGAIASLLIFRFLALHPRIICAVILAVWAFLYFAWGKGSLVRWVSWLAGFWIGWFTLEKVFTP